MDKRQGLFHTFQGKYCTVMSSPLSSCFSFSGLCLRKGDVTGWGRVFREKVLCAACVLEKQLTEELKFTYLGFVPKISQFVHSSSKELNFSLQTSETVGYKQDFHFIQDQGVPA